MVGGHPRETLEASFDVVHQNCYKSHRIVAETIFVASQVIGLLPAQDLSSCAFAGDKSPIWYLRLNHTKLADAILELCGIPPKETLRRVCLHILTRFVAPAPHRVAAFLPGLAKTKTDTVDHLKQLERHLAEAVANHGLPFPAKEKFGVFIQCCFPLPPDIWESIECLKKAIAKIRSLDGSKKEEPRRKKRFEDAVDSLKSVRDLIQVLHDLHVVPILGSEATRESPVSLPLFVSLDLGLRQRRKHVHGGLIFQCIVLPNNFFVHLNSAEHNEVLTSSSGKGIKVAEGGDYSQLVRKYRPPGNFATTFINYYSTAPLRKLNHVHISCNVFFFSPLLFLGSNVCWGTVFNWKVGRASVFGCSFQRFLWRRLEF